MKHKKKNWCNMANGWIYLKGDCPICLGQSKDQDCRKPADKDIYFCRRAETSADPNYRYSGKDDVNGFRLWVSNNGGYNHTITPITRYQPPKPNLEPLTRQQANDEYRRLAAHSGLAQRHRVDLIERGLTNEQINELHKRGWLWSWQGGQRCSPALPGATLEGYTREFKGYAIGVPDIDGLIIGAQIHSDHGNPKYYWASSTKVGGNAPDSITGDNPIGVYYPLGWNLDDAMDFRYSGLAGYPNYPKGALLAEGFLKPMIASIKYGYVGIGAAGGNFAGSSSQLTESLTKLVDDGITPRAVIAPDANCFSHKSPNVLRNIRATISVVKNSLTPRIAWWFQGLGKHHGDIDEVSREQINLITVEEFEAIASEHEPIQSINEALELFRQQYYLEHSRTAKTYQVTPPEPKDESVDYEYESEEERQQYLANCRELGIKYVGNVSRTGGGKTTGVNQYVCEREGVEQIFFVTSDPQNPPSETLDLNKWKINPGKHSGRTLNEHGKKRRAKPGDELVEDENCGRARTHLQLINKNVSGDDLKRICGGCPLLQDCRSGSGRGHGAISQIQAAMMSKYVISHPKSLPRLVNNKRYNKAMIVLDEALRTFNGTTSISFNINDLLRIQSALFKNNKAAYHRVEETLFELQHQMSRDDIEYYGENLMQRVSELGIVPEDYHRGLRDELEAATQPVVIRSLGETEGMAVKYKGLDSQTIRSLKSAISTQLQDQDKEDAKRVAEQELNQWLIAFLDILFDAQYHQIANGNIQLNRDGTVTLTMRDEELLEIIHDAKLVEFMDADGSREKFALAYGIDPANIRMIRKKQPKANNITRYQVMDLGRCSRQRGESNQERINTCVKHLATQDPNMTVFDYRNREGIYQSFEEVTDTGAWFVDSRASNDYKSKTTIAAVGNPMLNINQVLAEYITLTGNIVDKDDDGFKAYLNEKTHAEVRQLEGRARAQHRPDEHIVFYYFTECDLGLPTIKMKASDITWNAATPKEIKVAALADAMKILKRLGEKATQMALFAMTGIPQPTISRLFSQVLNTINSGVNNFRLSNQELNECAEILTALGSQDDEAASLADMFSFIKNLVSNAGVKYVAMALEFVPAKLKKRILSSLVLALPERDIGEIRQFYIENSALFA